MLEHVPTGYGRAGLDALRTAVSQAKQGDPMAPVVVLAPNDIAATIARRHLATEGLTDTDHGTDNGTGPLSDPGPLSDSGSHSDAVKPGTTGLDITTPGETTPATSGPGGSRAGIAGIDVTVISRLAERIAAPALAPRRPATRQVLASAWRRALRIDPGIFAETADHPATVRALVSAHHELRDLSAAELDDVAAAGQVSADLVRLHREVTGFLRADWYDVTELLHTATTRAGQVHAPVICYLPQEMTNAEAAFLDALGQVSDVVVLTGHTRVRRADEGVRARWPQAPAAPDLPTSEVATATDVLNASDSDDEVRCVVRDVVTALQHTPAHRVAVLYSAADPYAALLHEHLGAAGIRVNGTGSRPVIDRALPRALLGLLEMADDDVPRAGLFATLSSAPLRDFTGARIPVATWERVSREAGVVRGDDWQHRLDDFIDRRRAALTTAREQDLDGRAGYLERQVATAEALQQFTTTLRAELQRAAGLATWAELATWCQELAATVIGKPEDLSRLPVAEQYAATALLSALGGLGVLDQIEQVDQARPSPTDDRDGRAASLGVLREALEAELSEAVPRLGRFGDGVLVAPLSQAIGLDADVVHVVGLSEDLYPGRAGGDSLLPEALRGTVVSLRTVRQRHGAAYRHLLAAFAAAPRVVASFPRGDLRSSSRRLPSRWLLGTFRARAGDKTLAVSDWDARGDLGGALRTSSSFSAELLHTPQPATAAEWRTRARAGGQWRDEIVAAAEEMMAARAGAQFTRFDGNLTGVPGLPDYRNGDRTISPTALESYVDCPHGFFVERLLRVRPIEQPEDVVTISPMEIGNLIHRSFELLVADDAGALPSFGQPWSQAQRSRLIQIAREQAGAAERAGLTGHPRLWRRERDRIEVELVAMLDVDDEWRAGNDARVAAAEMPFGLEGHPPLPVPVPGGQVLMLGSADKVDVGRDGTVYVTDIKTGSSRSYKGITADDPLAGATRFQLPVYGLAARERFGTADARVHAEYWFVRRDPGRIGIDVSEDVTGALRETVSALTSFIHQGLFPPRPPEKPDYNWVQCHYCNPDGAGHGTARERWERQRYDSALSGFLSLVEPEALAEAESAPAPAGARGGQ